MLPKRELRWQVGTTLFGAAVLGLLVHIYLELDRQNELLEAMHERNRSEAMQTLESEVSDAESR